MIDVELYFSGKKISYMQVDLPDVEVVIHRKYSVFKVRERILSPSPISPQGRGRIRI